ncbi:MAG: transcription antitermination factor NusB, partial [Clostridiaceae bacterium]
MQNKFNRRKSRAIAMELLYSETVNARSGEITEEFLDDFISMSETTENLDRTYIRNILNIVEGKEGYLKGVISPFLKDWDINRLSRVNLSILKIAAGELLFLDDIPDRVSLNEALELSKIYSDEDSTSFINGVLDKILKAKAQGTIQSEADA